MYKHKLGIINEKYVSERIFFKFLKGIKLFSPCKNLAMLGRMVEKKQK
jgi:hypothetical protein